MARTWASVQAERATNTPLCVSNSFWGGGPTLMPPGRVGCCCLCAQDDGRIQDSQAVQTADAVRRQHSAHRRECRWMLT